MSSLFISGSDRAQNSAISPKKSSDPENGKSVIEAALKSLPLSPEEKELLDSYEKEFRARFTQKEKNERAKIREYIYGGRRPLVESENLARVGDFKDFILASREPLRAVNYQKAAESGPIVARKESFQFSPNNFSGVCLGAVISFFEEAHRLNSARLASDKFQEGVPLQAHKYQSIYENFALFSEKSQKASEVMLEMLFNEETEDKLEMLRNYGEEYIKIYHQIQKFRQIPEVDRELTHAFLAKLPSKDLQNTFHIVYAKVKGDERAVKLMGLKARESGFSLLFNVAHFKKKDESLYEDPRELLGRLLEYDQAGLYLLTMPVNERGHVLGIVIEKDEMFLFDPNNGVISLNRKSDKKEFYEIACRTFATYSTDPVSIPENSSELDWALNKLASRCHLYQLEPEG
ncbi:MAG: hypothetical protein WAM28_03640 [Chlamydiales bacterium]